MPIDMHSHWYPQSIVEALRRLVPEEMTPIEAIGELDRLRKLAGDDT